MLQSRQPLILFLEEPQASLWLADSARCWLLRVLRALQDGAVADVLVVPVGIAYDVAPGRVEQDGAVREGQGDHRCSPNSLALSLGISVLQNLQEALLL